MLMFGTETAGESSKVGSDICVVPDVLQTAVSVMTVVSEKWMERFVWNLDDLRSGVLASGEDSVGGSSDVGSDVCVVPDPLPTAVSMRTVLRLQWWSSQGCLPRGFRHSGHWSPPSYFRCSDCRRRLPRPRCRGEQRTTRQSCLQAGLVAPSDGSGCSWTSTSVILPLVYELQILLSRGSASSGGIVLIRILPFLNQTDTRMLEFVGDWCQCRTFPRRWIGRCNTMIFFSLF